MTSYTLNKLKSEIEQLKTQRAELLEALEMALKTTYSDKLHAEWTALIAKAKGEV